MSKSELFVQTLSRQLVSLSDLKPTPIVLIDGRAASGKSTLAKELQNQIFQELGHAPRLIAMDDLYPGWQGLKEGSQYLERNILQPISMGKTASWQIWDWAKGARGSENEPGNGWREFVGGTPLIVEGCGSLSKNSRLMCDLAVWVEAEPLERRARWKNRDGEKFDEFWGAWAAQEDQFYEENHPKELADLVFTN